MREIIGYAPIEPDGSVKMKVPANIAFGVEILDANGRRTSQRHRELDDRESGRGRRVQWLPHAHGHDAPRRMAAPTREAPSANTGAPADGSPFPNTDPTLFADAGETMAETYTRLHGVPQPHVDISYDDVWTDPNVRAKDASFAYQRTAALTTPPPVDPGCVTNWTASCRIVVNYETSIHPLWGVPRLAADGVTNVTCNTCHSPTDAMGAAQVPAAQLDLSDGASPDEAAQFNSYRELLFSDNQQELVNGALVDSLVQATDANGNPLFQMDGNGNLILDANGNRFPVLVDVSTSAPTVGGRRVGKPALLLAASHPGGTHAGWLTPAELKLISEWLDIGAQYFNDPFAAPPA